MPKLGHVCKCLIDAMTRPSANFSHQEPPNLLDNGSAPDLPARPTTTTTAKTPPPASPAPAAAAVSEQAAILKQYEEQQAALQAQRDADERARKEQELAQQREFEARQREQAERERLAQEQLMQSQLAQYGNQAAARVNDLERELLAMRGQYERDQLLLEQYDRVGFIKPFMESLTYHYLLESQSPRRGDGCYEHEHWFPDGIKR